MALSPTRSLQTERSNEPSNASSIAAFNLTARGRHSTRSGPCHRTHPASALLNTTPPQASTSSGSAPSSFTAPPSVPSSTLPPADTRRPATITIPDGQSSAVPPFLLAYEITSCEVSLLTSQNLNCPRLCVTNTNLEPGPSALETVAW